MFFIHCPSTTFVLVFVIRTKNRSQLELHCHLRTPVPPVVLVFLEVQTAPTVSAKSDTA